MIILLCLTLCKTLKPRSSMIFPKIPPVDPAHLLVVRQRFSYFAHHPELAGNQTKNQAGVLSIGSSLYETLPHAFLKPQALSCLSWLNWAVPFFPYPFHSLTLRDVNVLMVCTTRKKIRGLEICHCQSWPLSSTKALLRRLVDALPHH